MKKFESIKDFKKFSKTELNNIRGGDTKPISGTLRNTAKPTIKAMSISSTSDRDTD